MTLGKRFLQDFGGFWNQHRANLASKIEPKSMLYSKINYLKKTSFSIRKTNDFEGSRGRSWEQKSIQHRSNNNQKSVLTCEGILASIFHRFWWSLEAKLDPSQKSNKNGYEKTSQNKAPKKAL